MCIALPGNLVYICSKWVGYFYLNVYTLVKVQQKHFHTPGKFEAYGHAQLTITRQYILFINFLSLDQLQTYIEETSSKVGSVNDVMKSHDLLWSYFPVCNLLLKISTSVQFSLKFGRNKFGKSTMCNLLIRICFQQELRGQVDEITDQIYLLKNIPNVSFELV